jgi:hypothetical protein
MRQSIFVAHRFVRLGAVLLVALGGASFATAQDYWFESYERAVELIEDNRLDEAEVLLEQVIVDHPLPRANVRVPGNRFIDYLPYFQRARIQLERGEYESAAHSLDVSEAFGAVTARRRQTAVLRGLQEEVHAKLASTIVLPARPAETSVEKASAGR